MFTKCINIIWNRSFIHSMIGEPNFHAQGLGKCSGPLNGLINNLIPL